MSSMYLKFLMKVSWRLLPLAVITMLLNACAAPQDFEYNPADPLSENPVPLAPANISLESLSKTEFRLSWEGQSSFETGYQIERLLGSSEPAVPDTILYCNDPVLLETGMDSTVHYNYRIRGMNGTRPGLPAAAIKVRFSENQIFSIGTTAAMDQISFDPQGKFIAAIYSAELKIWSLKDLSLLDTYDVSPALISGYNISPQGDQLAIALKFTDSPIYWINVWSIADHVLLHNYKENISYRKSLPRFRPDSSELVFVSQGSIITILNLATGAARDVASAGGNIESMIFSPDGRYLITSTFGQIYFHSLADNYTITRQISLLSDYAKTLAVSSDGEIIAAVTARGELLLWKTSDLSPLPAISIRPLKEIFFIHNTHKLTIGSNDIIIFDADSGAIDRTITLSRYGSFNSYVLSPDGNMMAIGFDTAIRFWSAGDSWWIVP